jgi:hypothetical protein
LSCFLHYTLSYLLVGAILVLAAAWIFGDSLRARRSIGSGRSASDIPPGAIPASIATLIAGALALAVWAIESPLESASIGGLVIGLFPVLVAAGMAVDTLAPLGGHLHWTSLAGRGRKSIPIAGALALAITPAAMFWIGSMFPIVIEQETLQHFRLRVPDRWLNDCGDLVILPVIPDSLLFLYAAGLTYIVGKVVFWIRCPPAARLLPGEFSAGVAEESCRVAILKALNSNRIGIRGIKTPSNSWLTSLVANVGYSLQRYDSQYSDLFGRDKILWRRISAAQEKSGTIRLIHQALMRGNKTARVSRQFEAAIVSFNLLTTKLNGMKDTGSQTPTSAADKEQLLALCHDYQEAALLCNQPLYQQAQTLDVDQAASALVELRASLAIQAPISRLIVWSLLYLSNLLIVLVAGIGVIRATGAFS